MRTLQRRRVRLGFTLIEILIVVVILGILAAIVIPQFTDASQEASRSNLQTQLQTVRSQIELYNVQNPATAYDAATAVANFWDPLVQNDYLQTPPKNPLQNNSTIVGVAPGAGTGWVWAEASAGDPWTLNVYAVDENGAWFDGDGDGTPD
jgi:prepilin-type N-terminal cleavage/methylation domain-containing protein